MDNSDHIQKKNKRFVIVQVQHLNDEKYFEGERLKRDPGDDFIMKWVISKFSREYRDAWNISKCGECSHWERCGKEVKIFCEHFDQIID